MRTRVILNIPNPDHDPLEAGGFTWDFCDADHVVASKDHIVFHSERYGVINSNCQYVVIEDDRDTGKSDC